MPPTSQLRPLLRLAIPLVTAEIGWMLMGVVDTVMVGHLPNAAVSMSAAALAQILFNTLAFAVGGILLGLDTTIAQAHGAGEIPAANRWLLNGLALAAALTVLLTAVFLGAQHAMHWLGTPPEVLSQAIPTLGALTAGVLPLLLYFALRRYLQAFNHGRAIALTLITANLVNILFNWLLIYSHHTVLHLGPSSIVFHWQGRGVVGLRHRHHPRPRLDGAVPPRRPRLVQPPPRLRPRPHRAPPRVVRPRPSAPPRRPRRRHHPGRNPHLCRRHLSHQHLRPGPARRA